MCNIGTLLFKHQNILHVPRSVTMIITKESMFTMDFCETKSDIWLLTLQTTTNTKHNLRYII